MVRLKKENKPGDAAMGSFHPDRTPASGAPDAFGRGARWLTTNSLLLYLAATQLQRLWALLNSDVMQLLRRW